MFAKSTVLVKKRTTGKTFFKLLQKTNILLKNVSGTIFSVFVIFLEDSQSENLVFFLGKRDSITNLRKIKDGKISVSTMANFIDFLFLLKKLKF